MVKGLIEKLENPPEVNDQASVLGKGVFIIEAVAHLDLEFLSLEEHLLEELFFNGDRIVPSLFETRICVQFMENLDWLPSRIPY